MEYKSKGFICLAMPCPSQKKQLIRERLNCINHESILKIEGRKMLICPWKWLRNYEKDFVNNYNQWSSNLTEVFAVR